MADEKSNLQVPRKQKPNADVESFFILHLFFWIYPEFSTSALMCDIGACVHPWAQGKGPFYIWGAILSVS
jgi:hypothetical protein